MYVNATCKLVEQRISTIVDEGGLQTSLQQELEDREFQFFTNPQTDSCVKEVSTSQV